MTPEQALAVSRRRICRVRRWSVFRCCHGASPIAGHAQNFFFLEFCLLSPIFLVKVRPFLLPFRLTLKIYYFVQAKMVARTDGIGQFAVEGNFELDEAVVEGIQPLSLYHGDCR